MEQEQFAQMIEKAYKDALTAADAIKAAAEADREAVWKELEAAKEARKNAEAEGEKIAAAYFEGKREQLIDFTRKELLRDLARKHLEAGNKVEAVAVWLDVPMDFVKNIQAVMERAAKAGGKKADRTKLPGNARLRYENSGRGGTIYFENEETTFGMWWEFAGGNALALIGIPSPKHWETQTKLPLAQRDSILQFIGEQVIEDQASGNGYFEIDDGYLTIFK